MPDFEYEDSVDGFVCGLDEVGRAPLAGPVVAACVFIPSEYCGRKVWTHVHDSKLLSKPRREVLFEEITAYCVWGVAEACPREVEEHNIVWASFIAMRRAYDQMLDKVACVFELALIDGHITPSFPCPVQTVVKGDQKSVSIAAASILAKVYRDRLMARLAQVHPHYGWERNAGYPTPQHLEAIDKYGITEYHRRTFAPVRNYIEFGCVDRQMTMVV